MTFELRREGQVEGGEVLNLKEDHATEICSGIE